MSWGTKGLAAAALLAAGACRGGDGGRSGDGTGSAGIMSAEGDGSGSQSASAEGPSGGGTAGVDGTGVEDSAGPGGDGVIPMFDVGSPEGGTGGCGDGGGALTFSYIWIANTNEGTLSKLDTQTGQEVGRFWTHPGQGPGSPSRTSVNLLGDVAVSNRTPGGTMKFAAETERCIDKNGNGTIETSSNSTPLPWDQEECRLWYIDIPTTVLQAGPRPTAWEGIKNPDQPCVYEEPRLWVGYKDEGTQNGTFLRLDGETGVILDTVIGPNWGGGYGPYGGATNAEGDLWATGLGASHAIHIDADTLVLTNVGPAPGGSFYGMAVDADGDLWSAGGTTVNHWDVAAGAWTVLPLTTSSARGIQIDQSGTAWVALNGVCGVATVDVATETITNQNIPIPGCSVPVGVSIDRDQFVWVVDQAANTAFKLDPVTHAVQLQFNGLVGPYTYSDMTGSGLNLVVNPPG